MKGLRLLFPLLLASAVMALIVIVAALQAFGQNDTDAGTITEGHAMTEPLYWSIEYNWSSASGVARSNDYVMHGFITDVVTSGIQYAADYPDDGYSIKVLERFGTDLLGGRLADGNLDADVVTRIYNLDNASSTTTRMNFGRLYFDISGVANNNTAKGLTVLMGRGYIRALE